MALTRPRKQRFFFLLVLVLAGGVYLAWLVFNAGFFVRVEAMRDTEACREVRLDALVIRDETVVAAPANGTLCCRVPEGERVAKGSLFAYLETSGGRRALYAPRAGIVSYGLDGLEGFLQPDEPWNPRSIPALHEVDLDSGQTLSGGQPLARIVDNLSPVVLRVRVKQGQLPLGMTTVGVPWLVRGEDGEPFTVYVAGLMPDGNDNEVCLRVDCYPPWFLDARRIACRVVTERMSGLAVPRAALVYREGRPGLYLVKQGLVYWAEVKEERLLHDRAFISGQGLDVGTRYVTNPRWVREGVRLNDC